MGYGVQIIIISVSPQRNVTKKRTLYVQLHGLAPKGMVCGCGLGAGERGVCVWWGWLGAGGRRVEE